MFFFERENQKTLAPLGRAVATPMAQLNKVFLFLFVHEKKVLLAFAVLLFATAAHAQSRGEYLTRAADCQACHSALGGPPFAGGRAFILPFGVLYSPNITTGLGGISGYSDDDWVHMLHDGVGRGGRHLYPAMPYDSYTGLTRDDALAIKTYLMSLPPTQTMVPPNHISFPYNQRWGMFFWNLFNNPDSRFQPDTTRSADYNRGKYLVENLGHCAECHTPRNFMMGLSGQTLAGTKQDGWLAYNLTSDKTTGLGSWSDSDLTEYLSTGFAPNQGPASGPMAEAVSDSLRYLTASDIHDIVLYLRQVPAITAGPPAIEQTARPLADPDALGARIFAQACAGCHLIGGTGRQWTWAGLQGSHSAGDPNGTNIVQILSQGSHIDTPYGLMFMHAFTGDYTDQELAAVANYTISQFGGRQGQVTAAQIHDQRGGKPESDRPTS
jgi:mono/diheme cytochrome c family protein